MSKLNCGCGTDVREGFTNIDCDRHAAPNADLICDFRRVLRDPVSELHSAEPITEILLKHVLEHFGQAEVPTVLADVYAALAPGGVVVVDGPDLGAMAKHLAQKPRLEPKDIQMIYGEQRSVFDYHESGWDPPMLAELLRAAGFTNIQARQVDLCFVMLGVKEEGKQ